MRAVCLLLSLGWASAFSVGPVLRPAGLGGASGAALSSSASLRPMVAVGKAFGPELGLRGRKGRNLVVGCSMQLSGSLMQVKEQVREPSRPCPLHPEPQQL